jgi:CRISPR-associated endonuclease/helicase Cas3
VNIVLISECSGRALTETRRILDQFAERRGERTWQTAITELGLTTLKQLLRATARKNTAVACHWVRGKNRTELLWIVGNTSRFNGSGAVPTHRTQRNVLRAADEDDWHSVEAIRLLACMAALMHDLGKASVAFQAKLKPGAPPTRTDRYRHEWVSLRLFQALIRGAASDSDWLQRLKRLKEAPDPDWTNRLKGLRDGCDDPGPPLQALPPVARAVGWLILTHHRLPYPNENVSHTAFEDVSAHIAANWTSIATEDKVKAADCWTYKHDLPDRSAAWRKSTAKLAATMLNHLPALEPLAPLSDPHLMHLSRLALVLADHHYSSLPRDRTPWNETGYKAYANADRQGWKQRLDQHLVGVSVETSKVVRALPRLRDQLPRLGKVKALRARASDERFRWQNHAFDLATGLARASAEQGFFGINMASTGSGKTLANARILYGLAEGSAGARFSIALGLRTLTLQTGDALRERIFGAPDLGKDQVAVLVGGGGAVRDLHAQARSAVVGSESAASLLEPGLTVIYNGADAKGPLSEWLRAQGDRTAELVEAPILVSTIDHLMPASECLRGGHQIAPILRLLTSDLVLDEVDDYDLADLPAVSRLVHLAGVFGSRVLLSSATLPPSLVQGLFEAYRAGRAIFQRHRGRPGIPVNICCGWFDEFGCSETRCADESAFAAAHARFVEHRVTKLRTLGGRQLGFIVNIERRAEKLNEAKACEALLDAIQGALPELHAQNATVDPQSGKRISIGVVRMANVDPLIKVAKLWFKRGGIADSHYHVHLCVYHARYPLLVRAAIERELDGVLKRGDAAWLQRAALRNALTISNAPNHLFIVLASPIVEVGRDHDYDWAIAEPSSMRSLIQLAGRVRRHRPEPWTSPNIGILEFNLRCLLGQTVCFTRPGFEDAQHRLSTWNVAELIEPNEYLRLSAIPRIVECNPLQPQHRLVDLEHQRLRELMVQPPTTTGISIRRYWTSQSWLTGFPAVEERFRAGDQEICYWLSEADNDALELKMDDGGVERDGPPLQPKTELQIGAGITPWLSVDYRAERDRLADKLGLEPAECERRFGTIRLRRKRGSNECEWNQVAYHPNLGFYRYDD